MTDIPLISEDLVFHNDEIWRSSNKQAVSFPVGGNQTCFQVEERSFWFKHRNNCITSLVRNFPPELNGAIFDIGGGNGFVSQALQKANFEVVLVEPGEDGVANAKKRGVKTIICGTSSSAKLKDATLAAIGLFDVVEHVEEDDQFINSMSMLLKDGGRLYATVPAYQFLWSDEDSNGGHFRRYNLSQFIHLLAQSGLEVNYASYFFRLLPIPIFLLRAIPHRLGFSKEVLDQKTTLRSHGVREGFLSRGYTKTLHAELENVKNQNVMRFGGSCLIAATKRKNHG